MSGTISQATFNQLLTTYVQVTNNTLTITATGVSGVENVIFDPSAVEEKVEEKPAPRKPKDELHERR